MESDQGFCPLKPAEENLPPLSWWCLAAGWVNFPGGDCLWSASRASKSVPVSSTLCVKKSSNNNRYVGRFLKLIAGQGSGVFWLAVECACVLNF